MKTWKETREIFIAINAVFKKLPEEWQNRIDLRDTNLEGANLGGANLGGANLGGAHLEGAYLRGAHLEGAYLGGANLEGANLGGAKGIVAIQFAGFSMYIQAEYTQIGCEYRKNEEWQKLTIEMAVKLGIKEEHFEAYHAFFKAAMLILKPEPQKELAEVAF